MRNRLWIIILLMVWIGQGVFGLAEISPEPFRQRFIGGDGYSECIPSYKLQ